jgi:hypothetical protein
MNISFHKVLYIILILLGIYFLVTKISTPISNPISNEEGFSGITQKTFFVPVVVLSGLVFFVLCVIIYYTYLGSKAANEALNQHSNFEGLKTFSRVMGERAIKNKVPFRVYLPFILISLLAVIIGIAVSKKK